MCITLLWPLHICWLFVLILYKIIYNFTIIYDYLQICNCVSFWLHGFCGELKGLVPVNQFNKTSWMAVVAPTDRSYCGLQSLCNGSVWWRFCVVKQTQKSQGMFETQKSGNRTSSGEMGLKIRTPASPKVRQDQVSGWVSVLWWYAAPVANVLWKPIAIR